VLSLMLQTLFGAGDVLAQQAVDKKGFDKHDYARTGRMVFYGGGMVVKTSLSDIF
jgi:protein Mpv17